MATTTEARDTLDALRVASELDVPETYMEQAAIIDAALRTALLGDRAADYADRPFAITVSRGRRIVIKSYEPDQYERTRDERGFDADYALDEFCEVRLRWRIVYEKAKRDSMGDP